MLKEELAFWLTTQCEFIFISAQKLRDAREDSLPMMVTLQELREWDGWTERKLVTLEDALNGKYVAEYLALSYRCGTRCGSWVWAVVWVGALCAMGRGCRLQVSPPSTPPLSPTPPL